MLHRAGGQDLPPQHSRHFQAAQAPSGAHLPASLAPERLQSQARREGLEQFTQPVAADGQSVGLRVAAMVVFSVDMSSHQFLKRFANRLQRKLVCLFTCLCQRYFFSYEIHVFKISFRFFFSRQWSELEPASLTCLLQPTPSVG